MNDRIDLLIDVLFDKMAREDEKGDAIISLGHFYVLKALKALIKFGCNQYEPDDLLEDCGNSIGRICIGIGKFDKKQFEDLATITKEAAFLFIKERKPEWFETSVDEN